MNVSVVVCTRNRPELIGDCLEALMRNRSEGMEVLVVDQSTDQSTAGVVGPMADGDCRVHYLPTTTIGLSRARNIGVRKSKGDIIAFTDDDCVPEDDWVESIAKAFEKHTDVDAVYGRSLPWNDIPAGERPVGLKADTQRRIFARKCNPWVLGHGNNMSFRRGVFYTVGFFDEVLGPGGLLRNGDDADFSYRMLKVGLKAMYTPEPVVYHKQFRLGKERWKLEKDYGIGAGALCLKHLRCGDTYVLRLLLDRWSRAGMIHMLYGLLTGKSAHLRLGWYRIVYSIAGMWAAKNFKIDPSGQTFLASGQGGAG